MNGFRRLDSIFTRWLAGVATIAILAGPAAAEWQNYRGSQDGLADNQVYSILEGRDGGLWFGTPGGASRFDGVRWQTLRASLPSPVVRAILEARDGALWIGTEGGVHRVAGDSGTTYGAPSPLPSNRVSALIEDHRGEIWLGTDAGLVRHDPAAGTWTRYVAEPGGLVNAQITELLEDRAHRLWIGTPEGLSLLDSTRSSWRTYTADPRGLQSDSVFALAEDDGGDVWVGTDRGAFRHRDGAWTAYGTSKGLAGAQVTDIVRDGRGGLWFGGGAFGLDSCRGFGLSHFDGRVWRRTPRTTEQKELGEIRSLHVDRSGHLWVATRCEGLYRFDGVEWRNFYSSAFSISCQATPPTNVPAEPTLSGNCIRQVLEDHSGELWFAIFEGGVDQYDRRGRWIPHRLSDLEPLSDSVRVLFEDSRGDLWFGSQAAGLARLDSTRTTWSWFGPPDLPSVAVHALFEDHAGVLWAGTADGVASFDGAAWSQALRGGEFGSGHRVESIVEDPQFRLWFRSSRGLYRLAADRTAWSRVSTGEGLADSLVTVLRRSASGRVLAGTRRGLSMLEGDTWTTHASLGGTGERPVSAVLEDRLGRIWAGTDQGASVFEGGAWRAFAAQTLGSAPIQSLYEDRAGTVWAATSNSGLARWNGEEWRLYDNRGDGLSSNTIGQIFEDGQGHLWFASNAGATEHEPDRSAPQTVLLSRPPTLSASRNASFVFGAAYDEVGGLEYSVSWDGGAFSSWTPDATFDLTGVTDATHVFEVRARDFLRNVDPTPARYEFEVDATPPAAEISSPVFGQPVRGAIAIAGTAADDRFLAYTLEARPAGSPSWAGPDSRLLGSSPAQVTNDTLATWDTEAVADGDWELRLSVTDGLGLVGISRIRVIVDNVAPFANVTSPARIAAGQGGDVYTTNTEAHLYFPPGAFDRDAVVTVDSVGVGGIPETLPGGAVRASLGWELGWTPGVLQKDAVLELRVPAGAPAGVALWTSSGGEWRRIGGSPQNTGVVAASVSEPGRYALFSEAAAPEGTPGLARISLTPRVFSPRGSFARADVAIGFAVGRAGTATIKVYNRAGRLVRTVAEGVPVGAGQNLVRWDGRDRDGQIVATGMYVVTVEASGETRTETLAVVR